ncbi:MAG: potassium channel family protein [Muribaculaceae bacterium]|nr:potassium channel family protein [Muribaculaceae bacterium]
MKTSDRIRHFFHVVSNVRPIIWIGSYIALVPVFAIIYWLLPDGQFRIPDGAGTDFGSWLYYSIVTITTLGFGDYTPAHGWAQCVTAVEVMCGLTILGFFLNAVGSMKSEIDVTSEIEKQRQLHSAAERDKLIKMRPLLLKRLDTFIYHCENNSSQSQLTRSAFNISLALDSLQTRVDLTEWPELLENCFTLVADCQLFTDEKVIEKGSESKDTAESQSTFTSSASETARHIQTLLSEISA